MNAPEPQHDVERANSPAAPPPGHYQTPAPYQPPPPYDLYSARPGMPVRVMPPPPMGANGLDAGQMAQLGAAASALGWEQGRVARLVATVQAVSAQTALTSIAAIMGDMKEVLAARIARIIQDVRALPTTVQAPAQPQPGGLRALLGGLPPAVPTGNEVTYVRLDMVLQILTAAQVEGPAR